jgi:poly-gamma-glutamate synthesis protein (capsule biosynthesis protein)
MKKSFILVLFGIFFVVIAFLGLKGLLIKPSYQETKKEIKKDLVESLENKKGNAENLLVAGGDVILSRWVGVKIRESGDSAMPFRKIAPLMASGDITFINYEAPFLDKGPLVTEGMVFKAEPDFIKGLTLAGIDIVSLANNHMKNHGREGLAFTFSHLAKNNIKYVGAGENFAAAHSPAILESKGVKFGFLAYTYSDGIKFEKNEDPTIYDLAFMEIKQLRKDIESLKKDADVIIVSMHAGNEYQATPNPQQIEFAHVAIDFGANLVLGHHPHWVQTIEKYKNGFIIYSLGNLVFDQMWSQETREGVIAKFKFLGPKLKSVEFVSTKIENYSQPRFVTPTESKKILGQMELDKAVVNLE